jgi:excisionase family DNA binding protein
MKVEERLFTPKDVGERLGVSHYTVIVWLRRGWLKGNKYGKSWRVRESDLEAFIAHPPPMRRTAAAAERPQAPAPQPSAPPADINPLARKAALIARLRALQAEGRSQQEIANQLNGEGVPTISGKGQWQKGTIANLLAQGSPVE